MGFDSPWNLAFGPSVYYFSTPEGAYYHPSNSARPRPRALPSTHVLTAVCVACSYRPAMDSSTDALKSSSSASAAAASAAAAAAHSLLRVGHAPCCRHPIRHRPAHRLPAHRRMTRRGPTRFRPASVARRAAA